MKFSKNTLEILKNFAQINQNMMFKAGNTLDTISSYKNIYVKANIEETIENDFAIYNLNSLLQILTIADQEVKMYDDHLTATSENGKFKYYYTNPELIIQAPSGGINHIPVCSFDMDASEIALLLKASAITNTPTICIKGIDNKVLVSTIDRGKGNLNSFERVVGETDAEFEIYIQTIDFKILNDNYTFSVSYKEKGSNKVILLHLQSKDRDLQYWIASEPGSTI